MDCFHHLSNIFLLDEKTTNIKFMEWFIAVVLLQYVGLKMIDIKFKDLFESVFIFGIEFKYKMYDE